MERRQEKITKKRERAEANKWGREIEKERVRRRELEEQKGWHGSKKIGQTRRRLLHKLDRIPRQPQPVLISNAIRGQTQKWSFKGDGYKDPVFFLEQTTASAVRLIDSIGSAGKKVNGEFTLKLVKSDPVTGKDTYTVIHCRSKVHAIYDNANEDYADMRDRMLENFYKWQRNGSGWRLHSVDRLDIYITKFDPVIGKSYTPFPKCVVSKKAVINMENNDDQCFKWSITRALHPVERDAGQISKILRKQSENYNWQGLGFPVKVKNIGVFETNNRINVNVFSFDDETKKVYTLRLSKTDHEETINLFLYNEHYGVVKNLSRLVSSQKSKRGHKKHICIRCLNHFGSGKPPVGNTIGKGTTQYQHHTPSGFCYTITCMDDSIYKPKTVLYTMEKEREDIGRKFVESLERDLEKVYDILTNKIPIKMTDDEELEFQNAEICYACKRTLDNGRVRDHCHYTGKYRGAAHSECNLKMKTPMFVPVLFHNLEGYDSHLFVKSLGGKVNCIPKTDEKYISFSKRVEYNPEAKPLEIRILDSIKFTLKSLDDLVQGIGTFPNLKHGLGTNGLLKRKGVFPYEFMTGFDKLSATELPPKKCFYSKLNDEHINDEQYGHAQKVWSEFGCKTMRDYHDLYLKTDVLLLADVMENYRDVCIKNYGLDPSWYYTAPGLAWDAALKISNIKLELLTDPDMYLLVEAGIRGGISTITKRFAKANNPYLGSDYNPKDPSKYIMYLDANNLYGWAMSQPLPVDGFEWIVESELQNWDNLGGCILEVDLEYPKDFHDAHNEYPLAPESLKINQVNKLIPNLQDKTKYILHYKNLQQYLGLGMVLKIGIKFNERPWLKDYIQLNTDL